jgi:RTX calcium-binding nonapeptide repeat (4 copies)
MRRGRHAKHPRAAAITALVLVLAVADDPAGAQQPTPGCPPRGDNTCSIQASVNAGYILASGFTPRALVRYEVFAAPGGTRTFGPITKRTDARGNQNAPDDTLRLAIGNEIVITDISTGTVKRLVIDPVKLNSIDPNADTVSGTARPGTQVGVNLMRGFFQQVPGGAVNVTADGAGNWRANFRSNGVDVTPSMTATASVVEPDGDGTHADLPAGCRGYIGTFYCSVEAHVANDLISVQRMTPNGNVSLQVFSRPGGPAQTPPLVFKADDRGNTEFLDAGFDYNADIKAGSYVVARDLTTGKTKTLVVPTLSIDRVDVATDTFGGRAPPGALVETQCTQPLQVQADAAGNWSLNCAVVGYDLGLDDFVVALLPDSDGDPTLAHSGAGVPGCIPDALTLCGTAGPEALRAATAPAAATGAAAGLRVASTIKAGGGSDLVVVTARGSHVNVDLGKGREDKAVVRPGPGGARGTVRIHGVSRRMVVVLPRHAGALGALVTGTNGSDTVSTRSFRRGSSSGGHYVINGRRGNDRLAGGDGPDVINGGPGIDTCFAGRGDRVISCETVRRLSG